MSKLTTILKKDFHSVTVVTKGIIKGTIHGMYTPFLLTAGVRRKAKITKDINKEDYMSENLSHVVSAVTTFALSAAYTIELGLWKEYFGLITASNVTNYLVDAYKRSKTNSLENFLN